MVATRRAGRISASAQESSSSQQGDTERSPQPEQPEAASATPTTAPSQLEHQRVIDELEHCKVLLETEKSASLRHNIDTEQSLSEQENKINELEKHLKESVESHSGIVKERDLSRE